MAGSRPGGRAGCARASRAQLLRERGEAVLVPAGREEAAAGRRTTSGVTLPAWERPAAPAPAPTEPRNPFVMALVLLAATVGFAVAVALLIGGGTVIGSSMQDETLGNRPAAVLLVGTMIAVVMVVVGAVVRWAVRPRRADPLARRRAGR